MNNNITSTEQFKDLLVENSQGRIIIDSANPSRPVWDNMALAHSGIKSSVAITELFAGGGVWSRTKLSAPLGWRVDLPERVRYALYGAGCRQTDGCVKFMANTSNVDKFIQSLSEFFANFDRGAQQVQQQTDLEGDLRNKIPFANRSDVQILSINTDKRIASVFISEKALSASIKHGLILIGVYRYTIQAKQDVDQ